MLLVFRTSPCFAISTKALNSEGIFLISCSTKVRCSQPAE
uniref:Uncharacterized protein n=1 Tax=Arundo donax TaxID=35708 RepID=A0A0A9GQK5_ARUDO